MITGRTTVKIAVAETSTIVRVGLLGTLKRVFDNEASYLEIARPDDFNTRVASFLPDIIIVNPTFGGFFDVNAAKSNNSLDINNTSFVALLSSLVPSEMLTTYDSQISIFDDEDTIRKSLTNLFHSQDPDDDSDDGEQLSSREKQVIRGVVSSLTNKEIADQMHISVFTVLTHRRNIARKLNIHSAIALAIYAISNKIVSVDELK